MRKNYDLDGSPQTVAVSLARDGAYPRYLELSRSVEPSRPQENLGVVSTLLVEPNTLLREGLRRILAETAYDPVGLSSNLVEALGGLDDSGKVFLLIIDAARDHQETCQQVRQLKESQPLARAVMLVDDYDLAEVFAAFQAGADAYLMKSISCEVLIKTLDLVMLGETVFPSAVLDLLREQVLQRADEVDVQNAPKPGEDSAPAKGLSVRETVILRCLMDGDSNKLIARKFDITEATVKVHVKAILRKIHAKNRTQAAIWAASHLPADGRSSTN
ncbi:LuxR C-terminal-related transcriptional regulator [Microvirga sp. 2YAF29]|uniref:LuxR C-terminal-related transcriptional regulator n=1 Tax=Microvirga sp. 2YAF29 TaxID=3233031 RepID=UPI003F9916CD